MILKRAFSSKPRLVIGAAIVAGAIATTGTASLAATSIGSVTIGKKSHSVNGCDISRGTDYLVMYTRTGTQTTSPANQWGFEAAVVGGKVVQTRAGQPGMPIPVGGVVLSGHGTSKTWLADNARVGRNVKLPTCPAPAPSSSSAAPSPSASSAAPSPSATSAAPSPSATSVSPSPTSPAPSPSSSSTAPASSYNAAVMADKPVAFWNLDSTNTDLTGRGHTLKRVNSPATITGPFGEPASLIRPGAYFEAADANDLSVTNTGKITFEAWMRPDALDFSDTQSSSEAFVYWMGKGVAGQHEYTFRMYNKNSDRPNRISAYSYNLSGGLGAGSYFQDTVTPGQWIFVVAQIDVAAGTVNIWKNGVKRDTDLLSGYDIRPANGTAPLRIGTRDLMSYFQGGMTKVAVYNTILTQSQINAHYAAARA